MISFDGLDIMKLMGFEVKRCLELNISKWNVAESGMQCYNLMQLYINV